MYADIEKRNERRRERYYEKRQDITYVCQCCGIEYQPKEKNRDRYCSRECADKQKAINKVERLKRMEEYKSIKFCAYCGIVHSAGTSTYCSDKCSKEAQSLKKRLRTMSYKIVDCKCCGKQFMQEYKKSKVYCSDECVRTYGKAEHRHARRKRIKENGRVDQGININRLARQENNLCHICHTVCDDSDYKITDEGYFLAGDQYPSIDHVIPLSKGGTHTHDNVRLAHFKCNRDKSDSIQ